MTRFDPLLVGFPGRTSRGYLGWSSVILLSSEGRHALFDTGGPGDRPGLLAALAERNLTPAQIDRVILSHLHFDHVANVECFPDAEVVVHADEIAYFEREKHRDPAVPRYLVEGLLAHARLRVVEGEFEPLPGVTFFPTPGHTGGHASLRMVQDGVRVVLAQDALKHRGDAVSGRAPGSFNEAASARSIARILELADIVLPGHDAPLTIRDGRVVEAGALAETVTVNLDGRAIALEVAR
ncbi:MBL fold metallo-hydrolase [Aureimonas flava]|uniref:MBL fold metallo-hydrolase n=1 Tax=Aureimonas flava TaxID=2320271 RepID=A0A3A1WLA5_9HYPH|nr:MBL fold metallo-hydrolase [Aureimonas flava]RIY00251.1 MBL fold metallo-hydrolase [Aureimonas flava]